MPIPEWIRTLRAKAGNDLIMMTGASAIIRNEQGQILLHQRSDNQQWGLPGGAIEPGEEPAQAVIREVWEETGLHVQPFRIVGVYGGPDLLGQYPNGDRIAFVSIAFECRVIGGNLRVDNDESLNVGWFAPDALPTRFVAAHRRRIDHALNRKEPYFKPPD